MIFSLFALVLGASNEATCSSGDPFCGTQTCYAKDTDRATARLGKTTCETEIVLDDKTLDLALPDDNATSTTYIFDLGHPHCIMGSNLPTNVTYTVRFKASDKPDSSWTPRLSLNGTETFDPVLARLVEVKTAASSIKTLNAALTSCDCVGEVKDPEREQRSHSSTLYSSYYTDSRLAAKNGWCPKVPNGNYGTNAKTWVLIDLGSLHRVFGTILKGFSVGSYFGIVKKYRVEWSRDNETWSEISGLRGPQSRKEEDIDTLVYANFSPPVIARYVKIFHGDFDKGRGWYPWPVMRAGVFAGELERTLVAESPRAKISYDCAEGWHHKTQNNTEAKAECGAKGFTAGLDSLCAMECFTGDKSEDSYCSMKYTDKPFCSNNLCVECTSDKQCAGNQDNKYCGSGNRCSPCESDSECTGKPSGEYCSSSECVQCYNHTHCANSTLGKFCGAENFCVVCSDDEHCSNGKHCHQQEKLCVSCIESSHCSAEQECDRSNQCITTVTTTTTIEPEEELSLDQIIENGAGAPEYKLVESKKSGLLVPGVMIPAGIVLAALAFFVYRRHKVQQPGSTREDKLHAVRGGADADGSVEKAVVSGRQSRRTGSRRRERDSGDRKSKRTSRSDRESKRTSRSGRTSKKSSRLADSEV